MTTTAAASNIIRSDWPKIRMYMDGGKPLYQVDARKRGTPGKRESFVKREEAESRAKELAASIIMEGIEGMAIRPELRIMALQGENLLAPYNKKIADAIAFYLRHLQEEEQKAKTLTVEIMADKWVEDKTQDRNKPVKKSTLSGIKEAVNILKRAFGKLRLADVTEEIVNEYLNGLDVGNIRKDNIRRLMGQFFNWCIAKKHYNFNPAKNIEIYTPSKDEVEIFNINKVKEIMEKVHSEEFKELLPYHVICLFAGLRPTEAELLTWENIDLKQRQIYIMKDTTKVKEARFVNIEETLFHWLNEWEGEKKGLILNPVNRRKKLMRFRMVLGYKYTINKELVNPSGSYWVEDIMRHTFASYWLGKYNDRAHLAEQMGNSLAVIKKNYRRTVDKADVALFWDILPENVKSRGKQKLAKARKRLS